MALLGWALAAGALAAILFPALIAALFTLLLGLVIVATLRTRLTFGLAAAALGAVIFTTSDLVQTAVAAGSAAPVQSPGELLGGGAAAGTLWVQVVVAVVVLVVSAGLADGVSGVIANAIASDGQRPEPGPSDGVAATAAGAPPPGWARAAWELARAVHYRRPLTVALLSVDDATGKEMAMLDQLLEANLSHFEAICAPQASERLLVLPEEPVRDLREAAEQLCANAATSLRRAVRMALAGYPEDGTDLERILDRLRADLVASRQGDAESVPVDAPPSTAERSASGDDVDPGAGEHDVCPDEADVVKAALAAPTSQPGSDSQVSDPAPTPAVRRRRRRSASR